MANPFSRFFTRRFVEPAVKQETAHIKKQLNRAHNRLEEKEFDLLTNLSGRFGINSRRDQRRNLDKYISWAYANISVISERVADICFEMYQLSSTGSKEELKEVEDNPALDLLLRVNDFQTKWDLIYTTQHNLLSMGEAAWYLIGKFTPDSEPSEIWSLRPDFLEIIPGDLEKNQFIEKYILKIPGKDPIEFNPWEILFFKTPHPTNAYRGYGVLEAAMMDVDIDIFANSYNRNFFANQARPDSVLMTDNRLNEEVYERTLKGWQSRYQGSENAGKTAILEQGLKYMQVQPNAKDMDFLEQQKWTRDKIMALFKNTKVILGITDDVNRANAEASEYVWLKHNIRPKMQRIVDYLNEFFIPTYGDNLFLSFEDPLPESTELKLMEYEKAVDKWLTRNEIRAREGLDPVEGGDLLYMPSTQIILGDDPLAPPTVVPGKMLTMEVKKSTGINPRRFRKEIQVIKNRQARNKALKKEVSKVMKQALKAYGQNVKSAFQDGQVTKEIQAKRWHIFADRAQIFESKTARIVKGVINRHKNAVLKNITQKYNPSKAFTKSVDDLIPSDDVFITLSVDALTPLILALAKTEGVDVYEFLGMSQEFIASTQLLKNLDKLVLEGSESYISTMRERIKAQLVEGVQEGESIDKLKKRIRSEYRQFTDRKAETIARTETIRAANATSQDAFKQSNVVVGKQWFTAPDCVDPECLDLDGKIIDLDESFEDLGKGPAIYTDIGYPPLHPNCRCTISPILVKSLAVRKPIAKHIPTFDFDAEREKIREEVSFDMEKEFSERLDQVLNTVDL